MKRFTIALAQMTCSKKTQVNISNAKRAVVAAARNKADLCILPEIFSNRYVGQSEDVAKALRTVPDHRSIIGGFRKLAQKTHVAIVLPFIERIGPNKRHNSEILIGKDGNVLGHYRKMHIPDSEGYREDLYFDPGNKGYVVADIGGLKVGLGICWDQWFPEMARILTLKGAQLLVYPSAIGSEIAVPEFDSRPSWELVMRANAVMNRVFIAAVNRVGKEEEIDFYGGSFVTNPWGVVIARASLKRPETILASLNLTEIDDANSFFGFLSTRRPDTYGEISRRNRSSRLNRRQGR